MVDYFSIALTHGLLALAAFRLMLRADLDRDPDPESAGNPAPQDPSASGKRAGKANAKGAGRA